MSAIAKLAMCAGLVAAMGCAPPPLVKIPNDFSLTMRHRQNTSREVFRSELGFCVHVHPPDNPTDYSFYVKSREVRKVVIVRSGEWVTVKCYLADCEEPHSMITARNYTVVVDKFVRGESKP